MKNIYAKHKNLLGIPVFILTLAILYFSTNYFLQFVLATFESSINSNIWSHLLYSLLNYSKLPAIMLLGTYFVLRLEDKNFDSIFLHGGSKAIRFFFVSTVLTVVLVAIVYLVEFFMGWIDIPGFGYRDQRFSLVPRFVKVIYATFCTALMEEVFGRGVLMMYIERLGGRLWAIISTSILFGLMHLPGAKGDSSLYLAPINLFILGIFLALLVYSYKSLWLAIGVHFGWNLSIYNIFNLSGQSDYNSLAMITNMVGPEWMIGTSTSSFGIEAGVITTIIFCSSLFLLFYMNKKKRRFVLRPKSL